MDTWFTSDWHIGHRNIITYCDRPFADVEAMNEALIANHNALVKPGDLVIDVGDFSMSERHVAPTLSRLVGRHILVCGNHDKPFASHKGASRAATLYRQYGFEDVLQNMHMTIAGMDVLIQHMPYGNDSRHDDRYASLRPVDAGLPLLHGHVHGSWAENGKQINVGVDVRDYKPMHLDEVASILRRIS